MPCLLDLYLKGASAQYNKVVDSIAADALKFLLAYAYPGIYQELESLVQAVVLFFQAEVGIRDWLVTGVQTCALPISSGDPYEFRKVSQLISHGTTIDGITT